jgi:myosin heavy subunit
MNFLIQATRQILSKSDGGIDISTEDASAVNNVFKDIILDSSIVFEAFGNAKTARNDNSSRFGKYIKFHYTAENELVSAFTERFLLEKSRLVTIENDDERDYRIASFISY